ncbi:Chromatin assembly factor-1 [Balamuthia mandrillaris]
MFPAKTTLPSPTPLKAKWWVGVWGGGVRNGAHAAAANKLLTHIHAAPRTTVFLIATLLLHKEETSGRRQRWRPAAAAGRGTAPIEKHHEPLCASSTTLLEAGLNGKLSTFATSHGLAIHFGRVHKEGSRHYFCYFHCYSEKKSEKRPSGTSGKGTEAWKAAGCTRPALLEPVFQLNGRRLIRPEALCLKNPLPVVLEEEEEKKEREEEEEEEEEEEKEKEKEEEEKNQKGLLGLIEGLVLSRPAVQLTKKGKNGEEKPVVGRVEKIRLYPRSEQKKTLAKWFGTVRWTYNKAVESFLR